MTSGARVRPAKLRFAGLDAKRATRHVTFHVTSRDGISGPAAAASHASHVAFFPAAAARRSAKTCSYDSIYASHTPRRSYTRIYIYILLSSSPLGCARIYYRHHFWTETPLFSKESVLFHDDDDHREEEPSSPSCSPFFLIPHIFFLSSRYRRRRRESEKKLFHDE